MERRSFVVVATVLAILIVFAFFAGGMLLGKYLEQRKAEAYAQGLPSVQKVQEVRQIIDHAYVEPVSDKKLINGAVKGMLEALNDPYTHYLDATHFKAFQEETSGHFDGVGILVSMNKNKELVVVSPMEGTPAARAGIKPNDVIIKINDKDIKGQTENQSIKMIRGKRGTKVTLTVRREGAKEPLVFNLIREQINIPNVTSKELPEKLGYVRVHQFNETTSDDVEKKYSELKAKGIQGFILDLRGNPGGILDEAVNLSSLWIKEGPIVKIKSREGEIERRDAIGGADTKMPLVVLVDKNSASASEIVSGSLQDYGRAIVVGETTFGKASVQTVINLSDGSGILLTTDHYLTPKGRLIHKKGIKPDVEVKVDPKAAKEPGAKDVQLEKAQQVIQELMSGKRKLKETPLKEVS